MRGKQGVRVNQCCVDRITPAHAGKTCFTENASAFVSDHLRACGENAASCVPFDGARGSPPRVRGKLSSYISLLRVHRITPACAGKTSGRTSAAAGMSDHPRVCGENWKNKEILWSELGSPPRVRGKLINQKLRELESRITPACAGKTASRTACRRSRADHPRVCGENQTHGL